MSVTFLLYFALIAILISSGKSSLGFPCKLEWTSVIVNSTIGEDWVRVDSGKEVNPSSEFIARVKSQNFDVFDSNSGKDFVLASMQPSVHKSKGAKVAGVISEENVFSEFSLKEMLNSDSIYWYEVLTNPHKCQLSWKSCIFEEDTLSLRSRKYVRVSSTNVTNNEYIARIVANNGDKRYSIVGMSSSDREFYSGDKKSCLQATTTANLNVTQFEFDYSEVKDDNEDFMGLDQINNEAETTVVQTVTHRKIFPETYLFTQRSQESWEYLYQEKYTGWWIFCFRYSWSRTSIYRRSYSQSPNELLFEKEKDVISTRVMSVPGRTSIQACSTVTFNDDYVLKYTAEGRHTPGQGMSMKDLEDTIKAAGYANYRSEGDSIVVNMSGSFKGKLAFRSSFYVTESSGGYTCRSLQEKFERRNALKQRLAFNASDENVAALRKAEFEIQDVKSKMTSLH